MKKNYELMFIVVPEITEEERDAVITSVEEVLKRAEAQDVITEKMGEKKLAYAIDKKTTGFYVLIKFAVEGVNLVDVEKRLNINEKLMRYILVKQG
ncbi:30S ribosomal protein S6 [Haliovirga abyssi]|uniref:Small ribosomal subunit protein bS6 n=1 Tax=Haliovirga abyssi TaxID=2996794 RepID=A0AAU9E001_9FUSO|nr:30S ribosomal protein S6 [Haliovirga abyssi]BDU49605.1 30S ribosomal protein S6 [Haliovirga abyssi]